MDKGIRCNLRSQWELDTWQERTSSLDQALPKRFGRERKKKREKERAFRERSSTFSLDFPAIGLSNLGETRGKVDLHCKSYAWVPVLWSFDNSGR